MGHEAVRFFDVEERLARLSGLGDQLEAFSRTVDFEVFHPDLEKALAYSGGSKGGRSGADVQNSGDPDAEQFVRRTDGVSDQRPSVVHAFSGIGAVGPCA